nr:response regulator transcription factor [Actinoplanes subtropicus]
MIRVLIADDQTLVRTGFRVILEAEGDIEVVAEADTGAEAIRQARLAAPDVILMDIRMPEVDGLVATEEILRQPDPPTIVVLTTFDQNEYVYRALHAGAAGFLLKDAPSSRLIAAVRAATTGDSLIEPSITRRLVERFAVPAPAPGPPPELAALTERERDVLRLIARGLSKRRDRRRTGGRRDDREDACRPHPHQAGPPGPGAGGGARLPDRLRD